MHVFYIYYETEIGPANSSSCFYGPFLFVSSRMSLPYDISDYIDFLYEVIVQKETELDLLPSCRFWLVHWICHLKLNLWRISFQVLVALSASWHTYDAADVLKSLEIYFKLCNLFFFVTCAFCY